MLAPINLLTAAQTVRHLVECFCRRLAPITKQRAPTFGDAKPDRLLVLEDRFLRLAFGFFELLAVIVLTSGHRCRLNLENAIH